MLRLNGASLPLSGQLIHLRPLVIMAIITSPIMGWVTGMDSAITGHIPITDIRLIIRVIIGSLPKAAPKSTLIEIPS
ncbi:MAG: hypothetical protein WCL60_17000 [Methylococcales bacterium]